MRSSPDLVRSRERFGGFERAPGDGYHPHWNVVGEMYHRADDGLETDLTKAESAPGFPEALSFESVQPSPDGGDPD
jgi:hypothetical protein